MLYIVFYCRTEKKTIPVQYSTYQIQLLHMLDIKPHTLWWTHSEWLTKARQAQYLTATPGASLHPSQPTVWLYTLLILTDRNVSTIHPIKLVYKAPQAVCFCLFHSTVGKNYTSESIKYQMHMYCHCKLWFFFIQRLCSIPWCIMLYLSEISLQIYIKKDTKQFWLSLEIFSFLNKGDDRNCTFP